jgi:peptidoglycan/LPS O-acetylase OafA/YrhL
MFERAYRCVAKIRYASLVPGFSISTGKWGSKLTEETVVGRASARRDVNWSLLALARFVLAMIVMNAHLVYFESSALSRFISMFDAKAAVVGFLILSGYSVTASLDRNPDGFLFRRFLRIYPAYLFAILASLALQLGVGTYHGHGLDFTGSSAVEIIGNLLLTQMYLVKALNFDPVVWSLSIEFSYYIFIRFFGHLDVRWLWAMFGLSLAYFLLPISLSDSRIYDIFMKLNMVRCFWPFLLGVLLWRYPSKRLFFGAGIVGAAALYSSEWSPDRFQWLTYILTIAVMYVAQRGKGGENIVFDRLGDISYPLYLIHIPTGIFLAAVLGITNPWIGTVAALAAATAIVYVVEQPFRAVLSRLGSLRIQHERALAHRAPQPASASESQSVPG